MLETIVTGIVALGGYVFLGFVIKHLLGENKRLTNFVLSTTDRTAYENAMYHELQEKIKKNMKRTKGEGEKDKARSFIDSVYMNAAVDGVDDGELEKMGIKPNG